MVPGAFLISSTPLSVFVVLALTIRLPRLVSLSCTFAVRPGGTLVALMKANLTRLGAFPAASSASRLGARTKRPIRLVHGVPRAAARLQVTGTRHLALLQATCVEAGTRGTAPAGSGGTGALTKTKARPWRTRPPTS